MQVTRILALALAISLGTILFRIDIASFSQREAGWLTVVLPGERGMERTYYLGYLCTHGETELSLSVIWTDPDMAEGTLFEVSPSRTLDQLASRDAKISQTLDQFSPAEHGFYAYLKPLTASELYAGAKQAIGMPMWVLIIILVILSTSWIMRTVRRLIRGGRHVRCVAT